MKTNPAGNEASAPCGKQKKGGREIPLQELRTDVAGIDIGAKEDYVAIYPHADGSPNVRCFTTDTQSLQELADWLVSEGVHSAAMESTGVYWISLYQILLVRGIEVVLVDARSLRSVPGRKTDVIDCQWLRQLHACGLLRGCFLPDDPTSALRSLQRMRQVIRREREDWIRRIQKQLDMMNVRIHRAVSDITGVTGMAILRAILAGERDPLALARLRDRRCRKDEAEIARELTGDWRQEHLMNLETAVASYDYFTGQLAKLDRQLADFLAHLKLEREAAGKPTSDHVEPPPSTGKGKRMFYDGDDPARRMLASTFGTDLTLVDGIGVEAAATVFMELGPDIPTRFPTENQFVAYLRLAPNLGISGGHPIRGRKKRRSGTPPLKRILLTAAMAMQSAKTPLGDYYRKIAFRRGSGVAIFATAGKIARRIYRALACGVAYAVSGDEYWRETDKKRRLERLTRQAANLGQKIIPATPVTSPACA